jgi:UDP-N-acetylglucosamine 2-epimerase
MNVLIVGELPLAVRKALEDDGFDVVDPPEDGLKTSSSGVEQIAAGMRAFEGLLRRSTLDALLLAGSSDVTLAALLVATKQQIPVASVDNGEPDHPMNARLIEQLADASLADAAATAQWLRDSRERSGAQPAG